MKNFLRNILFIFSLIVMIHISKPINIHAESWHEGVPSFTYGIFRNYKADPYATLFFVHNHKNVKTYYAENTKDKNNFKNVYLDSVNANNFHYIYLGNSKYAVAHKKYGNPYFDIYQKHDKNSYTAWQYSSKKEYKTAKAFKKNIKFTSRKVRKWGYFKRISKLPKFKKVINPNK